MINNPFVVNGPVLIQLSEIRMVQSVSIGGDFKVFQLASISQLLSIVPKNMYSFAIQKLVVSLLPKVLPDTDDPPQTETS